MEHLIDLLSQIDNRSRIIAFVVHRTAEDDPLRHCLCTLIEDSYQDAQEMVGNYCVKCDSDPHRDTPD